MMRIDVWAPAKIVSSSLAPGKWIGVYASWAFDEQEARNLAERRQEVDFLERSRAEDLTVHLAGEG